MSLLLSKRPIVGLTTKSCAVIRFNYLFPFKWDQPDTYYTDKETAVDVVDALFQKGLQVRFAPFPTVDFSDDCRLQSHNAKLLIDCSGELVDRSFVIRIPTAYFSTRDQLDTFKQAL